MTGDWNTVKNYIHALIDLYHDDDDNNDTPFFVYLGDTYFRRIGSINETDIEKAQFNLDFMLEINGITATYLSSIKTKRGNLAFLAHS